MSAGHETVAAPRSVVGGLTRFALGHRLAVVLAWLAITVGSFLAIPAVTDALTGEFSLPGREGYETNQQIAARYGGGDSAPIVPVVTLPAGVTVDSPGVAAELRAAFDRAAAVVPEARVASYPSTGDPAFVSADRRTTFALIHSRGGAGIGAEIPVPRMREALRGTTVAGAPVMVTGIGALSTGNDESGGIGILAEVLAGGLGALIVLVLVFRSPLAAVPLLMAVVAIPTTFALIGALTAVTEVSLVIQVLVALIGLGVAIDFALVIVMRWREERAAGRSNDEAVRRAMDTAGRAVALSGVTVAIGLVALVALPVPLLRSVGLGGALIPLVSVAVATTLLPVLLATVGPRLDRMAVGRRRGGAEPGHRWAGLAALTVRYRWPTAIASIAVLLALAVPGLSISPGEPEATALATTGEARDGLDALERSGIGSGALTPFEVLTTAADPEVVAAELAAVDGVRGAVAPTGSAWRDGESAVVEVLARADGSSTAGERILHRIRAAAAALPGEATVGGVAAFDADFVDAVYGNFPLVLTIIVLITFLLLARAFRSLVLPLKAIVFNLLSLGAVYGALVLVWQEGFGSEAVWGIDATGAITAWVPLMVFAFLFGLSMDYEVFILARMREEYDATGSTDQAVVRGLAQTGRLVTSAALILFLAFVAMSANPGTEFKVFATGLAIGILLDATVVRALLLPALVSLMGRWNWYLPEGFRRALRLPRDRVVLPGAQPVESRVG